MATTRTKKTATKKAGTKSPRRKATPKKKATPRKTTARKASAKKAPAKKTPAKKTDRKLGALDAAAKVLGETKQPMNCKELIEAMAAKKLWTSPGGKTPHSTLYAALLREINGKGKEARFKKTERGKFALA